jgi:hypothetical protein
MPSADPAVVIGQAREQVTEMAERARDTALTAAGEVRDVVGRHPYATIAAAAGFAFIVGALWKVNQPRSRYEALWDQLPSRADLMGRSWR